MSLVSSDISPSVTAQLEHQINVPVVRANGSITCKGGDREKTPVGKTLISNNVKPLLKSAIGNETQWA
jgi:hypothetical protein